jgi:hypothetical protein
MSKWCCGKEAAYIEWNTFSYWFCKVCRKEVTNSRSTDKEDNSQPSETEFPDWSDYSFY